MNVVGVLVGDGLVDGLREWEKARQKGDRAIWGLCVEQRERRISLGVEGVSGRGNGGNIEAYLQRG